MTTMNAIEIYKAARAAGRGTADACGEIMSTCGVGFDDAVALSWHVETGKPAPRWVHEDGTPTAALRIWERGLAAI